MDRGFHRLPYRFSPDDYKQIGEIWNGLQAETGEPCEVQDGPPEGGEVPGLNPAPYHRVVSKNVGPAPW